MGQDRKAYLTGHHKHGEDKDKSGFGHREPAGLLEGEEYGSIQAGLGGAGRDSRITSRHSMAQAFVSLSQDPSPPASSQSQLPSDF